MCICPLVRSACSSWRMASLLDNNPSFITVTKCNVLLCRVDQHYISCSHDDDAYKCVSDDWNRYNYDTRGANTWTNHNCLSVHCDQSVTSRCPLLLSLLLPFHTDLYVLWQRQSDRCLRVRQPTSQSSNTCRSWDSQVQGSSTAERQCISRTFCDRDSLTDASECANQPPKVPTPVDRETPKFKAPAPLKGSAFPERLSLRKDFIKKEQLTEILAALPTSEKADLGFKTTDMFIDCQYDKTKCSIKWVTCLLPTETRLT